jgi:hypothetical protein
MDGRHKGASVRERFWDFLEAPGRDSYLAVREALVRSEAYQPYDREFQRIDGLLRDGQLDEASRAIQDSLPNLLISPMFHLLATRLCELRGDQPGMETERAVARMCVEGILASGAGSADNPYVVARTSDEYDVLRYLGKELERQALIESGDRHLDLMRCTDGSEMWFDVTDVYNHLLREMFGKE